MIANPKKLNTTSVGIKATAILMFLILLGLVFFLIFIRYELVAIVVVIGLAVAIIGGRKVVKNIIAAGIDQTGRRGNNSSRTDDTTQAGRGDG
jgi:membrane protein required for beta-lactamase induction